MCALARGDGGAAGLHRLAQRLQRLAREFRQFVEEQHAAMGQADLARPGPVRRRRSAPPATPNDAARGTAGASPAGRRRSRPATQWIMLTSSASRGVRSGSRPGSRAASIDLPAPGGPISNRLWPPAAAISSAALGALHALHVGRSGPRGRRPPRRRLRRGQHLGAAEMVDQRQQVGRRQHLDPPGPGRLAALAGRADQPQVAGRGADRRRQHAGDRVERAVQRQVRPARRSRPSPRAAAHPSPPARASAIGRSKWLPSFSRSAGARLISTRFGGSDRPMRGQRGAHPFAALAHRLVGQADQQEGGQCRGRSAPAPRPASASMPAEGEGGNAGEGHAGGETIVFRKRINRVMPQPGAGRPLHRPQPAMVCACRQMRRKLPDHSRPISRAP